MTEGDESGTALADTLTPVTVTYRAVRFLLGRRSISGCLCLIALHVPLSTFILRQWKALPLAKLKKRREVQASVTRIIQEKLYKNEGGPKPDEEEKRRARVSENNNTDYIGKQFNWRSTGTQVFTREVDVLAPS